jgi:hypothetical protein
MCICIVQYTFSEATIMHSIIAKVLINSHPLPMPYQKLLSYEEREEQQRDRSSGANW